MQPSSRDAVKRVLSTAGITGAALTLSAAAALPAFACPPDGGGSSGTSQSGSHAHGKSDKGKREQNTTKSEGKGDKHDADAHDTKPNEGSNKGTDDSGHNPPGNNGTVFIHQVAGDSHPHNQPHVACSFFVSLFGFDKGQSLSVSFAGQAPTGKDVALPVTDGTPTTKTSTTHAGGAGHDFDGDLGAFSVTNLDVANKLGAPAKQGWHIKLTVDTRQGGGHKYKVFWLAPCGTTPATSGNQTSAGEVAGQQAAGQQAAGQQAAGQQAAGQQPSGPTVSGEQAGGAQAVGENASAGAAQLPTTSANTGPAQVLGESATRVPSGTRVLGETVTAAPSASSLPFTGTEIGLMSAAGAAALGGGIALTVAGLRRRRATAAS